mmetsp:Transcript_4452/g.8920  ORF Transcript_4452/g.8920 Transcript_4452/m.8920 type:complete len:134 (-) Transcript_4452:444-845(-)
MRASAATLRNRRLDGGLGKGYARAVTAVFSGHPGSSERTGLRQGVEVISSTLLQMLLYFNAYYSVVYAVLIALIIRWKVVVGKASGVGIIFFALWGMVESFRLYLGFVGNLKEKVPHFAGFFFLSVLQLIFVL